MHWIPLKTYCDMNPWPSLHTIRWMIYRTKSISGVHPPFVKKLGHKLVVDHDTFQQWINDGEGNELIKKWSERQKQKREKRKADQLDLFKEGIQNVH